MSRSIMAARNSRPRTSNSPPSMSATPRATGTRIRARIVREPSNSNVFVTKPGAFTDLAVAAIEDVTGRRPELSTTGGTSDARFIASYCPVIEFGLVGQTMHQIDERAAVSDLEKLTKIYRGVLERYFA